MPRTPARPSPGTNAKPALKTGAKERLSNQWRRLFLDCLAETSNVSKAAKRAGTSPSRAYKLRRHDAEFAGQWRTALLEGYEHLELETLDRLRHGTAGAGHKFDIANALRLLAMHKETVARERARQTDGDEAEIIASINAKIEQMRQRESLIEDDLKADTGRADG